MSDGFGDIPFSKIFSDYDPLEAGDIGDVDVSGQYIGSLYPDITSNIAIPDLENLLSDTDLFAAFANFDPESAALLSGGNLTKTGTLALTGEGIIADAAQDAIAEELGQDATKIGSLTQDPADSALVNPADINKNVKVTQASGLGDKTISDLAKYLLPALASYLSYKSAKDAQQEAKGASFGASSPVTATRKAYEGSTYKPAAQGGIMSLAGGGSVQPMYLGGITDGMADEVPAHIDGKRPAALSDGEFVIPADVVSHLGNGNSNAGAQRLYKMMDDIREARTGNRKQGIEINPNNFMPR